MVQDTIAHEKQQEDAFAHETPTEQYGFWHPELKAGRALFFKLIIGGFFITSAFMIVTLGIYWGSIWNQPALTYKLEAWFVDLDGQTLGATAQKIFQGSLNAPSHLGWQFYGSEKTEQDAIDAVLREEPWVAVIINANATSRYMAALASGNASYNPMQAISVYYSQARSLTTIGSFILPPTQGLIAAASNAAGAAQVAQFFAQTNATSFGRLAAAPQLLVSPFSFTLFNLRPFTAYAAFATTQVGLINLLIFGFYVVNILAGAMIPLTGRLKTGTIIRLLIFVPAIFFFFFSLWYTLASQISQVPLTTKYGHGGFFLLWLLNFISMAALGYAQVAVYILLKARDTPFFLILWVTMNTTVFSTYELMGSSFYEWQYAMPFYHTIQGAKTIIFDTANHLGLNFGVLIAWCAISFITIPLFTVMMQRKK